ncbi:MAG: ABC transporter ATP-binding protein [Deltaproteobacteria bacterium]|nr:ABC transporter ATP-binding protein [Deltaproteobacteria bacterium]
MTALIDTRNLTKIYRLGDIAVKALDNVTLSIGAAEFTAIMGHSGSGKSTFMNILGCLDRPTSGQYLLEGEDVSNLSVKQLATIRNRRIGFVFQGYNLLRRTSALENVELPLIYSHIPAKERRMKSLEALEIVGLSGHEHHHSNQLSGGQQQRVAIARALVNNPSIILADEPTGNLDTRTSFEIMGVFRRLNSDHGITVIIVTHEPDIAAFTRRHIVFRDGQVIEDLSPQSTQRPQR